MYRHTHKHTQNTHTCLYLEHAVLQIKGKHAHRFRLRRHLRVRHKQVQLVPIDGGKHLRKRSKYREKRERNERDEREMRNVYTHFRSELELDHAVFDYVKLDHAVFDYII